VHVALRPAVAADRELLLAVYASTRLAELEHVPWDAAAKAAFLRSQAEAQDADYRTRRPDADFLVITVDGQDVGRLYRVELPDHELRLMDIALLPDWRGRGIGRRLLQDLVDEADRRGLTLTLHVEHQTPVRRLYDRLGFVVTAQDDVNARMERRPS
jgi:ribosomal protein S18 acetylase RimI-like enzyme